MITGVMLVMAAGSAPVDYAVAVTARLKAPPAIAVTLTFVGDRDGETAVELPSQWAGSKELWRALSAPQVTGGTLIRSLKPEEWRIRHRPGARLTVRYTINDAVPGLPDAEYEKARPEINPSWFYLHGEGVIAIPVRRQQAPARFRWIAVPLGWRMAADVEHSATPLTANGMGGGIFIGGQGLMVSERRIGAARLRIASIRTLPGGDAALTDRLERLMRTENAMLGARPVPYLVTAIPLTGAETGALSYGGTGRTAGFALAMTDNVTVDQLSRLIAHEYAHRWFGDALGRVPDDASPYWPTEGVNDWFAARAMVAAGLWTPQDWVRALNEKLLSYGISRARDLTDAQVTERFWTDPDAMQVQYDRGQLMALLIDRRLNGGLVQIVRAMLATRGNEQATLKFARLVDVRATGATAAARAVVARPLPEDLLQPCGRIETVVQPRYDRGFDMDDKRIVTAVRGAALAAGVRPGWHYAKRVSFAPGDSSVPLVAVFDTGAGERELSWLPRGSDPVMFQRLDGNGAATPACRALVAGSSPTP